MMATLIDHRTESEALENRPQADLAAAPPVTDSELLRQFVQDRREEAFAELVARHAAMVLGVCKRVLRDDHEAEDVFQATFLILANKGRQIQRRHPASLAAWLHRVAYRAAVRAAQAKHRKGRHLVDEVQATETEQWLNIARQEEQLVLHEELNKLPELYRAALVLCCLEGQTCQEAARQLDATPAALQKRVDRGKQMLRMRLARRGVSASIAILALGSSTVEASTLSSLVSLTSEICAATALHADGSIYSTNVGRIAQQGVSSMKLFTPTVVAATLLIVGTPLVLLASFASSSDHSASILNTPIALSNEQLPEPGQAVFIAEAPAAEGEQLDEKIRIILDRQKGDTVNLYLNTTRAYVNGKQISPAELKTIVRELGAEKAVISAEPDVALERLTSWQETLREVDVEGISLTQPKPKPTQEQTVARILARQNGKQLKIYLKGSRGIYVNGTQVSTSTLKEVIRQAELDKAMLSAELEVLPERVSEVETWLLNNGIDEVEKVGTAAEELTLEEVAATSRQRAAREREEKLRKILARQEGDQLKFYLNDRGVYINGTSISTGDLATILSASGLNDAVINAEWYLAEEKVTKFQAALQEAGAENVEVARLQKKAQP